MKALKNESTIYVTQIASAITECYEASANPSNSELMELYCFIGRCICQQGEKAFVVHLAEILAAQLPNFKGFSPRNLRRMRDFYRTYTNSPSLMAKAIELGWTQNTIILECCETNEQRSFYIGLTVEKNLSKLALMKAIEEDTFASTQSAANCTTDVTASFAPVNDIDTEQSVDTATTIEAACGAFVPACEPPRQGIDAPNSFIGIVAPETDRLSQVRPPAYQVNCIKTSQPLLHFEQLSQAQHKAKVIHIRGQTPSDVSRGISSPMPKAA